MKKLLMMLAATTALAGCATTAPTPVVVADIAPPEAPTPPPPVPAAKLGSFGFDQAGMDSTVLPGNNFYQFANGTWAKNTPIPADKANYGMFGLLDDLSKERTRIIVEEAAKDPANKTGIAYAAYLDTAAIEARGLTPIKPWLDEIDALPNNAAYAALAAKAGRRGVGGPFGFYVGQDDKNPDRYVAQMSQSGIGMPDRDYYLSTDAKIVATRAQYVTHLTNVLTLAGRPNAAARAKAILVYETAIARAQWTRTDSRDATKTYNLMSLAKLGAMAPGFDFKRYLSDSGVTVSEVIIAQPSAVTGIARLVSRAPLQVMKDQLLVRTLDSYAAVLPAAYDKAVP